MKFAHILLLALCLIANTMTAQTDMEWFTTQGTLSDSTGQLLNGTVTMTIRFYLDSTGGAAVYTTGPKSIQIVNGIYTFRAEIDNFAGEPKFVETEVNNETLSPRQRLSTVPYAMRARALRGAGSVVGDSGASAGGINNQALGKYSFIGGGKDNFMDYTDDAVVIGGGQNNWVSEVYGSILGGRYNRVHGQFGVVAGGGGLLPDDSNSVLADYGVIGGGTGNVVGGTPPPAGIVMKARDPLQLEMEGIRLPSRVMSTGTGAVIAGGSRNSASGDYSVVSGGYSNAASNDYSVVGGGYDHNIYNDYTTIGGGYRNSVAGEFGTVGGGHDNSASAISATVAGGGSNSASNNDATVGGGLRNRASGYVATIAGGLEDTATGVYSTIGGGHSNNATDTSTTVSGGSYNTASDGGATVGGGKYNTASNHETTIGGGGYNTASDYYSTIGGGGYNRADGDYSVVGGGFQNFAYYDYTTVAGGHNDTANGDHSTVGGGENNVASGDHSIIAGGDHNAASGIESSIGGGTNNIASGKGATIPGGERNAARGNGSAVLGNYAKANHTGSIVISAGDINGVDTVASGGINQMVLRASSGLYITLGSGVAAYDPAKLINTSSGAYLGVGGTWTNSSDRNKKENFQPVDGQELLKKLSQLSISQWNYKSDDPSIKHIGPMAQDFYELFGLGNDDKAISTIDPAGIALAAIKELSKQNYQLTLQNNELLARLQKLEELVKSLAAGHDAANSRSTDETR